LHYRRPSRTKLLFKPANLALVNAPAFYSHRARGVDAKNDDLTIRVRWGQVVGYVFSVLLQRQQESREHIMQRHIMISWNHDLRLRKRIEKGSRRFELIGSRALREITRHGYYIRFEFVYRCNQRAYDNRVNATEMKIR